MTVMASASPQLAPVATVDNARLAAQVSASERKHRLKMLALLAPSVIFTALFFVLPLALFMFRSVDNPEIQTHLPRTAEAMRSWSGKGEPDEAAFAAIAREVEKAPDGLVKVGALGAFRVRTLEPKSGDKGSTRRVVFRPAAPRGAKQGKGSKGGKAAAND